METSKTVEQFLDNSGMPISKIKSARICASLCATTLNKSTLKILFRIIPHPSIHPSMAL
jgi:cobalamin biosynthesis protein CobT